MTERITLIIASRNRGAKIGPTIASVFAQTRVPDQVMVVNDGCNPETRSYLAEHFPQVRVEDVEAGSAGAGRNHGVRLVDTPIVMFLDDDDLLQPHAVETLYRTLRTFPEARVAYADHTFTNQTTGQFLPNHHHTLPNFQRLNWAKPLKVQGDVRLLDRALYRPMLRGNLLQQPWMIEREAFWEIDGYTSIPCNEDLEMYLRVLRKHKIALTDTVISDHILEKGRVHLSQSTRFHDTSLEILRKHLKLCLKDGDIRSVLVILRKLGMSHKTEGDRLFATDRKAGWREYLRSFRAWPLDYVVAARALVIWPLKLLTSRGSHHNPGGSDVAADAR